MSSSRVAFQKTIQNANKKKINTKLFILKQSAEEKVGNH
jgi:hypothetical protein